MAALTALSPDWTIFDRLSSGDASFPEPAGRLRGQKAPVATKCRIQQRKPHLWHRRLRETVQSGPATQPGNYVRYMHEEQQRLGAVQAAKMLALIRLKTIEDIIFSIWVKYTRSNARP